MERTDEWLVPLPAFRECVVIAVAYRDYSILGSRVLVEVFYDRVVVTSPGTLPNHKRPESVLAGGTPRSRPDRGSSVWRIAVICQRTLSCIGHMLRHETPRLPFVV